MAGAFSGHLVNTFEASRSQISSHGPMSFNPSMHGTPSFNNESQGTSEETMLKMHRLQAKLNQRLGPEYVSQRPGPGGQKLTYAEGWKIINLANEVFGFNGWSSSIVNLSIDNTDFNEESRKWNVGVSAIVRVTLRDGTFHEDVGYGILENSKTKGPALDKCKKEAVTDALKRALRNFGNLMGNCLYDKSYTQEVVKIKVQPAKFEKEVLHRRPEFETKPSMPAAGPSSMVKSEAPHAPPNKPISSVPPHIRSAVTPNAKPSANQQTPPPPYKPAPAAPAQAQYQPQPRAPAQPLGQRQQPAQPLGQRQQPAQANVPERFAAPSPANETLDADESFNFSDDDAFLAQVDLGDADMGRPIDFDEGRGNDSTLSVDDISMADASGETEPAKMSNMGPPPAPVSRGNAQSGQVQQRSSTNQPSVSSTTHTSALNTHNQNQPIPTSHNHNSRSTSASATSSNAYASGSRTSMPAVQQHAHAQPASNHRPASEQARAGSSNTRPLQNQPAKPARLTIGTSSSGTGNTRKPPTPSMGGFNFPPGMDPSAVAQQPPPQRGPIAAPQFSLKRTSDAMNDTSKQSASGTSANTRREPFAQLELGKGGDVKRAKY